MTEVAELKTTIPALEEEEKRLSKELDDALAQIPNLPADDVPDGKDDVTRTCMKGIHFKNNRFVGVVLTEDHALLAWSQDVRQCQDFDPVALDGIVPLTGATMHDTRLAGSRPAHSVTNQHRDFRVCQHLVRHAAEKHCGYSAASVRCHDDEIAAFLLARGDDGLIGLLVLQIVGVAGHAGELGGLASAIEHACSVLFDLLGMLGKCLRHLLHFRFWNAVHVERRLNEDHGHFGSQASRQRQTVRNCMLR
jgi:hypothetical protein